MRVKFQERGQQRAFLNFVKQNLKLSLRKLSKKEKLNYELLKKYYQEKCFISKKVFDRLCFLVKLNQNNLEIEYLSEFWGQSKGGKS